MLTTALAVGDRLTVGNYGAVPDMPMPGGQQGWPATTRLESAGIAQRLEHQPSKLRVAGSNPVSRSIPAFFPSSHPFPVKARSLGNNTGTYAGSGKKPGAGVRNHAQG